MSGATSRSEISIRGGTSYVVGKLLSLGHESIRSPRCPGSCNLVLITKNTPEQCFFGPSPERTITCVVASICDVDEENDIIYVNTEDIAFIIHHNTASLSIKSPLVARLVAFCSVLCMTQGSPGALAGCCDAAKRADVAL
jgi:hypothetical protein